MSGIVVLRCLKLFVVTARPGEQIVIYPDDIFIVEVEKGEIRFVITPTVSFRNTWTWVLLADGSSHYYEVLSQ